MSNKIVDVANEVNSLTNDLENSHKETLDLIEKALNQITDTNAKDGGVFSDGTTQGINKVVDLIRGQIMPNMREVYTAHEQGIQNCLKFTSDIDHVC